MLDCQESGHQASSPTRDLASRSVNRSGRRLAGASRKSKNGCAASTPLSHTPPSKTRTGAEMLILHLHVPVAWCVINAVFEDCFRRRLSLTNREDDLGCDFLAEYETCMCSS